MSDYACEVHGTTVPGRLDSVYLTLRDGPDAYRRKLRLCQQHVVELLEAHENEWLLVNPVYGRQVSMACHKCGGLVDFAVATCSFYADVYVRGQDKAAYGAIYCMPCAATLQHNLDLVLDERPRLHRSPARQVMHDRRDDHAQQPERGNRVARGLLRQNDDETPDDHGELEHEPSKPKQNGRVRPA